MQPAPISLTIRAIATLVVTTTAGCGLLDPGGCDAYLAATLSLTVADATTAQEIRRSFSLTVISQTSGDSTVMEVPADVVYPFAIFQSDPGNRFTVDVKAAAYQPWRRAGIEVGLDGCGRYKTRALQASLVPQ